MAEPMDEPMVEAQHGPVAAQSDPIKEAQSALFERLGEAQREKYWSAFQSFLRFEISKPEFDQVAGTALGECASLHNAFVWAMLRSAVCSTVAPVPEPNARATYFVPHSSMMLEREQKRLRSDAPVFSMPMDVAPPPAPELWAADRPAAPTEVAPLLSLKIKRDSTGALVSEAPLAPPALKVDPAEEDQLNCLQQRMIEVSQANGVRTVRPEAVAVMNKALKGHIHALLAAGASVERRRYVQPYPATLLGGAGGGPTALTAAGSAANGAMNGAAAGASGLGVGAAAGAGAAVQMPPPSQAAKAAVGGATDANGRKRQLSECDLTHAIHRNMPASWMRPPAQQIAPGLVKFAV